MSGRSSGNWWGTVAMLFVLVSVDTGDYTTPPEVGISSDTYKDTVRTNEEKERG